jgi:hypothetical protein
VSVPVERLIEIDAAEGCHADGPRDQVGEFEREGRAVRPTQGFCHLAHLLDQPSERSVNAAFMVTPAESSRDLTLQGGDVHAASPAVDYSARRWASAGRGMTCDESFSME